MAVVAIAWLVTALPSSAQGDPGFGGQTGRSPVTAQAPPQLPGAAPLGDTENCEDGVVKDDGSAETGWGWVPSVIEGVYVQEFRANEIPVRQIDEVCVCWLRTGDDDEIDFEVVFYRDAGGMPEEEPYVAIPASLDNVPDGIIGTFVNVSTPGVRVPVGTFYIGVRWDASVNSFFFVCADTSEDTEPVNVWFRDDRAGGWDNTFDTIDRLFEDHKAILVRPVASQILQVDVPIASPRALALLAALLAGAGLFALKRR